LILNNLDVKPHVAKGVAYDASGKGKAVVSLTTAAEALWSSRNARNRDEPMSAYHSRRASGLSLNPQAAAPEKRSVTLNPEEGRKSGSGRGKAKRGRSKGSGGGRR